MPTISDFTKAYDVQPNTIRQWSKTFGDFLSAAANPPKGETRLYSEDDGQVIALIAEMRQDRAKYEAIRAALAAGDRGQWPIGQPAQDTQGQQNAPLQLITELTAAASRWEYTAKTVTEERDRLIEERNVAQDAARSAEMRAERAETELKILREVLEEKPAQDEKPTFWQRVFGRT